MKIQRFEYWFKSRIYVFSMEIVLIYVFLTLDIVANTMTVHPDNEVGKCSKYILMDGIEKCIPQF